MGIGGAFVAAQAIASVSQVASGLSAMSASKSEASQMQDQADLALQESRVAAAQKTREVNQFQSSQAEGYANSGVTLQGSPLQVLADTHAKGQQEIDAIRRRGIAESNLYNAKARQTLRTGRASFMSSLFGAASSATTGAIQGSRAGLYGGTGNNVGIYSNALGGYQNPQFQAYP